MQTSNDTPRHLQILDQRNKDATSLGHQGSTVRGQVMLILQLRVISSSVTRWTSFKYS